MADNKENAKKTAPKQKSNKPSFGERIKKFFRDYGSELKKITWSPAKDVKSNTIVVLVSIAVVCVIIALLDVTFSGLISWVGTWY
ncbi:MAG: preprotein translocase subunit SecE [Clostridia bacterium]|nr:preprotein translocase subunit SecE [Clostridia bacterium]